MEFEGRITKVLPTRSGTSMRGEWKVLPFVFEYFERADDRYSDRVLLETMDHAIMGKIGAYVERGADGKGIVENGAMKMKSEIRCRCGFSHNVRDYTDKEGKQGTLNQMRVYKFEIIGGAPAQPRPQIMPAPQPQPQNQEYDDLPF